MPKGIRISLQLREIICRLRIVNDHSPEEIFEILYNNDPEKCSLRYLREICSSLRNPNFRQQYLLGGRLSPGRPLSQPLFNRLMVRNHILENKSRRVCKMYQDFCLMFYPEAAADGEEDNPHHILSLSTFNRTLKRGNLTRKKKSEKKYFTKSSTRCSVLGGYRTYQSHLFYRC